MLYSQHAQPYDGPDSSNMHPVHVRAFWLWENLDNAWSKAYSIQCRLARSRALEQGHVRVVPRCV